MESIDDSSELKGPPKATLARRAKSYSDFYEAAIGYLGKDIQETKDPGDCLELLIAGESNDPKSVNDSNENDLLDASLEEYQSVDHQKHFYFMYTDSFQGYTEIN